MTTNAHDVKTFYDPYPDKLQAMIPLPEPVLKAARELNGKKMSLQGAVAYIQTATTGEVSICSTYIALKLKNKLGETSAFRLIRFK